MGGSRTTAVLGAIALLPVRCLLLLSIRCSQQGPSPSVVNKVLPEEQSLPEGCEGLKGFALGNVVRAIGMVLVFHCLYSLMGKWLWVCVLSQASPVSFLQEWSAARQRVVIPSASLNVSHHNDRLPERSFENLFKN